jgi:cytochrome c553
MGAAGAPFPRLAGLPVEYLTKQLFDYRDDSRANAIMVPIAKALTDADIASLAWHYASLRVPAEAPAAAAPQRGRPSRDTETTRLQFRLASIATAAT